MNLETQPWYAEAVERLRAHPWKLREVLEPEERVRAPCGTANGYRFHLKYDRPACQPCKDANTAYAKARNYWRQPTGRPPGRPRKR